MQGWNEGHAALRCCLALLQGKPRLTVLHPEQHRVPSITLQQAGSQICSLVVAVSTYMFLKI